MPCQPVRINSDIVIGDGSFTVIAGPCSVENAEQIESAADYVKAYGGQLLRGGAFKPRTKPNSFQGLGEQGLDYLLAAKALTGLPIVTELMDVRKIDLFLDKKIDVIQVGSRNMQNFDLLKVLGQTDVPIILKRGLAATIEEWLGAAEYVMAGGNHRIILCERGIRSFEPSYRNMLDISAVAYLKQHCQLPIIVDPSHAAGRVDLIEPLSLAAKAVGADGILVETHPHPEEALSDKEQALSPILFKRLMKTLAVY